MRDRGPPPSTLPAPPGGKAGAADRAWRAPKPSMALGAEPEVAPDDRRRASAAKEATP